MINFVILLVQNDKNPTDPERYNSGQYVKEFGISTIEVFSFLVKDKGDHLEVRDQFFSNFLNKFIRSL